MPFNEGPLLAPRLFESGESRGVVARRLAVHRYGPLLPRKRWLLTSVKTARASVVALRADGVLAVRLPPRRLMDIGPEARQARVVCPAVAVAKYFVKGN